MAIHKQSALRSSGLQSLLWLPAGVIGAALLFGPLLTRAWPLGDGGLFYVFTRALMAHNFHLPAEVIYNGESLPFAYPPLGFYLAGGISWLLKVPLLQVFLWLPAVLTWLQIPLFYLLTQELFDRREFHLGSTMLFMADHTRYSWLLFGGGVTRALAYTLALLGMWFAARFFKRQRLRDWLWASLLGGAVLTAHAGTGFAYSLLLTGVLLGLGVRNWLRGSKSEWKRTAGLLLATAGLVLFFSAPWWSTVMRYHGWQPFQWAFFSGFSGWYKSMWIFFPFLPYTPLKTVSWVAVLAWIGLLSAHYPASRRWPLFFFIILIFALMPRSAPRLVSPLLAWLAYMGVEQILHGLSKREHLIGYGFIFFIVFTVAGLETLSMPGITALEAAQLRALDEQLPRQASVLVLPPQTWAAEWEKEWLPAVTNLRVALLVQGSEWNGQFMERIWVQEVFRFGWKQKGVQAIEEALKTRPHLADYIWVLPEYPLACEALQGQDFLEPQPWRWNQGCLFRIHHP